MIPGHSAATQNYRAAPAGNFGGRRPSHIGKVAEGVGGKLRHGGGDVLAVGNPEVSPLRGALLAAPVLLAGFLLVSECAYGGGMGAAYRTCECLGVEWQLYDRRPADGPRRTLCVGIVRSRTCYRLESGPVVPCP
jgi:hypothetical protein